MDTRVSLERLDVDNYATWSVRMRFTLIARGLWEHVINDGEVTDKAGDQKALALIGLMLSALSGTLYTFRAERVTRATRAI